MLERRALLGNVLAGVALVVLASCSGQAQTTGVQAVAQAQPNASSAAAGASRFVILYRPGPTWRAGVPVERQNLREHGRYMQSLLDDGRLFAAGALADEASGGLVILNVGTLEEARAIMATDPAIIDGVLTGEARPWRPRFYSDGALMAER